MERSNPFAALVAAAAVVSCLPAFSAAGQIMVQENAGVLHVSVETSISPTTVSYATENHIALAGTRYTAVNGTLTFTAAERTKTIDIPLINDSIANGPQDFRLNLFPTNGATFRLNGGDSFVTSARIEILDDETPTLNWEHPGYTFNETDGQAVLTVLRGGEMTRTVSVSYEIGLRLIPFLNCCSYYYFATGTLTFGPNETSKTITVPIVNDNVWSGTQTWQARIYAATNGAQVGLNAIGPIIGDPSSYAYVTLFDDDLPAAFSIDDISVLEGNSGTKTVNFTVTVSQTLYGTMYVTAMIEGGTAHKDVDYSLGDYYPLVFLPNTAKQTIPVTIYGDTEKEPDESFSLVLVNPSTSCCGIPKIAKARGTCTILNDDDFAMEPATLTIARGTTENLRITGGAIPGSEPIVLTSSNPEVALVPASMTNSVIVPVRGLRNGNATISAKLPASAGGATITSAVTVYDPITLTADPQIVTLSAGTSADVTVHLSPLPASSLTLQVAADDASIVEVPATINLSNTGFGTLTLKAIHAGTTLIAVTLPPSSGAATTSVRVQVVDAPVPHVAQLSPVSGPAAGGTSVTLNGQNFRSSCTVFFGGIAATQQTFTSDTLMSATAPAHAAGNVAVTMSCSGVAAPERYTFTYLAEGSRFRGVRH